MCICSIDSSPKTRELATPDDAKARHIMLSIKIKNTDIPTDINNIKRYVIYNIFSFIGIMNKINVWSYGIQQVLCLHHTFLCFLKVFINKIIFTIAAKTVVKHIIYNY